MAGTARFLNGSPTLHFIHDADPHSAPNSSVEAEHLSTTEGQGET